MLSPKRQSKVKTSKKGKNPKNGSTSKGKRVADSRIDFSRERKNIIKGEILFHIERLPTTTKYHFRV